MVRAPEICFDGQERAFDDFFRRTGPVDQPTNQKFLLVARPAHTHFRGDADISRHPAEKR